MITPLPIVINEPCADDDTQAVPPDTPGQALASRRSDIALAEIITPTPVFVDVTGRRRHRLRWLAYVLGVLGLVYTGLVVLSFVVGPVSPDSVLPFVDSTYRPEQISSNVSPSSGPAGAAPSTSGTTAIPPPG